MSFERVGAAMSTGPRRIGKYELQERLGRGGMGEVWRAFDTQLQRHVAIKLLHTDLQNDASFVNRFQREAQVIASLHHSNIVQVYDFQVSQPPESENTTAYMVMDYVEGQTLAQYIAATSRVTRFPSAADIVHLFTYVSLAIDHAHSKGMIHRDIKPSNILLDKRQTVRNAMGEPVLTDFGIAKLLGSSTTTLSGWWFGTPLYTSPEQAKGSPGNERSDLYSLGIILYEVCTGVLPFQGENAAAILMQHINATPISPAQVNTNISPALAMVILRSIAKEPVARFSSAAAMTVALAEALNVPVPEALHQSMKENKSNYVNSPFSPRPEPMAASPIAAPDAPPMAAPAVPVMPPPLPTIPAAVPRYDSSPGIYSSGDGFPVHPNPSLNTPLFAAMPPEQRYFMVQEFMGGENLEERLNRLNRPLEERDVLLYVSQVLDTLNDLTRQMPPVVHGNIRPSNIVIGSKDNRAHLIGFNAMPADPGRNAQWKQTPASGTQGYAPLEQLQGHVDPRSDLYALAASMHHLLTYRNPRNNPQFSYPLVRTLNPQLSSEVELLLVRALLNDITQRYQNAAEMKRDIDDILLRRYGISAETAASAGGLSAPIVAIRRGGSGSTGSLTVKNPSLGARLSGLLRPSESTNGSSGGNAAVMTTYPPVPQPLLRRHSSHWRRNALLILLLVLLVGGGLLYSLFALLHHSPAKTTANTGANNGIGVVKVPDGEYIGLSDGSYAFDTNRPGGNLMQQAAAKFRAGDVSSAESLWQEAWQADTGNAEPLIYLEDQRVIASGYPYVTLVVATMFDANDISVGQGDLQGAYLAQREYNVGYRLPGGKLVRLLVANAAGQSQYASTGVYATNVARQIVQAARADKTIVGVLGWPYSGYTTNAIAVLGPAHIPMVSQTASSGKLSGVSPYFFRVNPPDSVQAAAGAKYAADSLHARSVALFMDPANTYSNSLGTAFQQQFTAEGNKIVALEKYTVSKPQTLANQLQDALNHNPDLIYFSGYSKDADTILSDLPTSGKFANLLVMGGDGLYTLSSYSKEGRAQLGRLRLTSFAYPDEWGVQGLASQEPAFFKEYPATFDPDGKHQPGSYGYNRESSEVMLAFDAATALLTGSGIALSSKSSFTPADLRDALATINGKKAFQGVSGQVAFGPDGNPINKAVVVLSVTPQDFFQIRSVQGQFLRQGS